MSYLFGFIAVILILCFFFRSSLGYESNLNTIHTQLEWIAVILLMGFAQLDFIVSKFLKKQQVLLEKIVYNTKQIQPEEVKEAIEYDKEEQEKITEENKTTNIIGWTGVAIIIIFSISIVIYSSITSNQGQNKHVPAVQIFQNE